MEPELLEELGVGSPEELVPENLRRRDLRLPSLAAPEVARHFSRLAEMNYGVDSGSYWLGSCTMKYNPKLHERLAALPQVTRLHPYQPEETVQGALQIMFELAEMLAKLTGLPHYTLQPAAGAHGEFTGALMIRAYHQDRGESQRDEMLIPVSAHGSNFASAAMAGFKVVKIPSDERGRVDMAALREAVGERTAGMMLTNPNTLGLFETEILEIADLVHGAGGLIYYDGANLNAILGRVLLSDMGVDVAHLNLHKTFSAPHGSGGPGAGAVGVVDGLKDFLPVPLVRRGENGYYLDYSVPKTIGRVRAFCGNFGVVVKAWAYLKRLGSEGVRAVSGAAVLNANYVLSKVRRLRGVSIQYGAEDPCKHEFVISLKTLRRETGVRALEVAKRLLDLGVHPPTMYFPLIVEEALMIEPTESDSKRELDRYVAALERALREAYEDPDILKTAPRSTAVGRLDEVLAARKPILSWRMYERRQEQA
ncbi:MAG: aminomethyl-transferring glycine dehydrogenase subunit GcvPB [Candidatus Korarchaeota archaeon]|nr:aminomethyl-transferring glycine dehydrogenase subunit GcvPB [Candidatus Korarchaeota archaeon]